MRGPRSLCADAMRLATDFVPHAAAEVARATIHGAFVAPSDAAVARVEHRMRAL
jgi:hypothetical protein